MINKESDYIWTFFIITNK